MLNDYATTKKEFLAVVFACDKFRSYIVDSKVIVHTYHATTEKEFLAVVFACDKFRPYIVDSKVTVHTDHAAIKHLMEKIDAKTLDCNARLHPS